MTFDLEAMQFIAGETFGTLGEIAVANWRELNRLYFADQLRPIPIVPVSTLPYNRRGECVYGEIDEHGWRTGRRIVLVKRADRGDLLHEMIHQYIFEVLSQDPSHAGAAWRSQIMRLNLTIAGEKIWAGPSITIRYGNDVVRSNAPGVDGTPSLSQREIADWPSGFLDFGPLDDLIG